MAERAKNIVSGIVYRKTRRQKLLYMFKMGVGPLFTMVEGSTTSREGRWVGEVNGVKGTM